MMQNIINNAMDVSAIASVQHKIKLMTFFEADERVEVAGHFNPVNCNFNPLEMAIHNITYGPMASDDIYM